MESLWICIVLSIGFIWMISMLRDIVIELRYLNILLEKLTKKRD